MNSKPLLKGYCARCVTLCLLLLTFFVLNAPFKPVSSLEKPFYQAMFSKWKGGVSNDQIKSMKKLWRGLVSKVDKSDSFEMKEVERKKFSPCGHPEILFKRSLGPLQGT